MNRGDLRRETVFTNGKGNPEDCWKLAGDNIPGCGKTKLSTPAGVAEITTDNFRCIPHRLILIIPHIPPEISSCGDVLPDEQCNF